MKTNKRKGTYCFRSRFWGLEKREKGNGKGTAFGKRNSRAEQNGKKDRVQGRWQRFRNRECG